MVATGRFRIAYIGGGSRFVVTLLHGLAEQAEALKALGRPVELWLVDPNAERAGPMAEYAAITARQTGLELTAHVTGDRERALDGAEWVVFSAGLWEPIRAARKRFGDSLPDLDEESGPGLAIEAAALWPFLRGLGADMLRLAPDATFSTLVNPTDVLAAAFEKAFGIQSVGLCVEVPQLVRWLSFHLDVDRRDIRLDHTGPNHGGWVSRWTIAGRDGTPLLAERLPERLTRDDWDPYCDEFAHIFLATGLMRTSPYHHWPFRRAWDEEHEHRRQRYLKARGPLNWDELRQAMLQRALDEGRMIEENDLGVVRQWLMPYTYADTRHTLGALAVGLAGGSAGPAPIQVRNAQANPALPAHAWLEVPTVVASGEFEPQFVPPLPEWVFSQMATLVHQRVLLADWLAGRDSEALAKALLAWPTAAPLESLVALARDLPALLDL